MEVESNNNNNRMDEDVKMEHDVINNDDGNETTIGMVRTAVDSSSVESTFNKEEEAANSLLDSKGITEEEQDAIRILHSFKNIKNNSSDNLNNYAATIQQRVTDGKSDPVEQLISNRVRKLSIQEEKEISNNIKNSTANAIDSDTDLAMDDEPE